MHLIKIKNRVFPIIIVLVLVLISCGSKSKSDTNQKSASLHITPNDKDADTIVPILVGANRTETYVPILNGKRVGIVANQTSVIFKNNSSSSTSKDYTHLVDSLLDLEVAIKKVFAPEHGFRGKADAGEIVKDGLDVKTGLPIVSLYGNNKKPSPEQLFGLDIVVFDIQDVGARFYTYISTLHYLMEACTEAEIPIVILDRPNPNGHYVDGPILELEHQSFVGMHPIPTVHGMTIGEYAKMINGEAWLKNGIQCTITVIEMKDYNRNKFYSLPIKPSPNLPNDQAVNLYPSLCFFEGTNVNAGRGTSKQFQIYGSPYLDKDIYTFKYIPMPNEGAKYPKHDNTLCFGEDLSAVKPLAQIDLSYLIRAYNNSVDKSIFFTDYFMTLAGTTQLQKQIENGLTESEIKATWKTGIDNFKTLRAPYLIYK